jgi:hypothetical protein
MNAPPDPVERFIARWQGREGGQERANYGLFLSELCDAIGVSRPQPASATTAENDYVFERAVKEMAPDGAAGTGRIDLYKKACFVLEAKQSRQPGGNKEIAAQPELFPRAEAQLGAPLGVRTATRAWDVLMRNARVQAERYARALPVDHGWPPFILIRDVGHVIEVYADFSGQGKNYAQFPDRQSFRVYLEDLRRADIRELLAHIWTDPLTLDPARKTARVTRAIAERLAAVSKALEEQHHDPEEVALFLMRCLFTMFAEDVELLPSQSFRNLLKRCEQDPSRLGPMVSQLWKAMDEGDFAYALETKVRRFNGVFFKTRTVLPLGREEIGELRQAASHDWRDVDPSIFGTLLEQALDAKERRRLGAHYTPRAYVERLVVATVIEPLRADWDQVQASAERQKAEGRANDAAATVASFHEKLCRTRILDPACGTGNFLYVSLELLKRLEGEVLEALADLGGQEALRGLEGHTVDPHQFLGLEINPRAAAIAELVLWIGYLQWHFRTKGGMPGEPILREFRNIQGRFDAVLKADISLARDARGVPLTRHGEHGELAEVYTYQNPHQPDWPEAEFIVGNPPFIGGKDIRARLGDEHTQALWLAHRAMNDSADFVMYWWDHAAELLTRRKSLLRRFGLVTTNSISQVFQRRVMERHLTAKEPVSMVMAVPDHPWTKAGIDAAAVRIAMTVVEAGTWVGVLRDVVREEGLDTDAPLIEFSETVGMINSDLTVGVDVSRCRPLLANEGLSSRGMSLHGAGFIVTPVEAQHLGLGRRVGLDEYIRTYRNGRDLTARPRGAMVIDLFGLSADEVRNRLPEVYQHVATMVKPAREAQFATSRTKDAEAYARDWWLFGKPRQELRPALNHLPRFIATVETTKHRVFQFLDASVLPDNMLVAIASDDGFVWGVLSSRVHVTWTMVQGGTLEDRPRYTKSKCFDPFPFPAADDLRKHRIRAIAEDLDAHRKRVLTEHPHLTLTGLYNVLEKLRAGQQPAALSQDDRRIFDDGLVLILKEYHDKLDAAVADAYGWPGDLKDSEILARLVTLNAERAREESEGLIRWLRPDYQIPRFGSAKDKLGLTGGAMHGAKVEQKAGPKPSFPTDNVAQTAAVMAALASSPAAIGAEALAAAFRQGRRALPQLNSVLASLVRMGFVASPDGGRTYIMRRAA